MISFLRSVQALAFFGIMLIIICFRLYTFAIPYDFSWETSFLPGLHYFSDFAKNYPKAMRILEIFWVLVNSWYFNFVIEKHNLLGKKTYVPAFFVGILLSSSIYFTHFGPILILLFPFILFIDKVLAFTEEGNILSKLFDVGLLLCLMSSIFFPLVVLLPLIIFSLFNFRPISLRELSIFIVGFALPLIFILSYLFLFDKSISEHFSIVNLSLQMPKFTFSGAYKYLFVITCFAGLIVSFPKVLAAMQNNKIRIRKSYGFFFSLLLFSVFSLFISAQSLSSFYFLSLFPLSLFFSILVLQSKQNFLLNLFVIVLISSIVLLQYYWIKA